MNKCSVKQIATSVLVVTPLLTSSPAIAEDVGGWSWEGEVYFWGADIGGTAGNGADIDISLSDLLDNLEFALMGTLWARRGNWTLFLDAIYLDVAANGSTSGSIGPIPATAQADLDMKTAISTLGAGYKFYESDGTFLNVVGGARALHIDTQLDVSIGPRSFRIDQSETNWDGIVGLAGQTEINENWYLTYYADVGTGDSDMTWQARIGASYKFKNWDLTFGYRHLDYDLSDDLVAVEELEISGPYIGARFRF